MIVSITNYSPFEVYKIFKRQETYFLLFKYFLNYNSPLVMFFICQRYPLEFLYFNAIIDGL